MSSKRVPVARRRFEAAVSDSDAVSGCVAVNGQVVCASHGALRVVLLPVPEGHVLIIWDCVPLHLDLPWRPDTRCWLNRISVIVFVVSDFIVVPSHHSRMGRMRGRRWGVRRVGRRRNWLWGRFWRERRRARGWAWGRWSSGWVRRHRRRLWWMRR
jgi:hypothetical protein